MKFEKVIEIILNQDLALITLKFNQFSDKESLAGSEDTINLFDKIMKNHSVFKNTEFENLINGHNPSIYSIKNGTKDFSLLIDKYPVFYIPFLENSEKKDFPNYLNTCNCMCWFYPMILKSRANDKSKLVVFASCDSQTGHVPPNELAGSFTFYNNGIMLRHPSVNGGGYMFFEKINEEFVLYDGICSCGSNNVVNKKNPDSLKKE